MIDKRTLALFVIVSVLHFVLSVAGVIVALPAAFAFQSGGFWASPGKVLLAWIAAGLLAPLTWVQPLLPQGARGGYAEIAVASVLFGAAAVGVALVWRAMKERRKA
jgi:hypothetical protein